MRATFFMIYGLSQYYSDELAGWNRMIEFHRTESRALVSQVMAVQDQQIISLTDAKECGSFVDQFMVQQLEFEYLLNKIVSQQQRVQRGAIAGKFVEQSIYQQQDTLRGKMQTIERTFLRTKYNCSIFLSAFLNNLVTDLSQTKVLNA